MENFSFSTIVALLALLLTSLSLVLARRYRKKAAKVAAELSQALEKLAAAHLDMQALQQRYQDSLEFQKNLSEAEITTRLQQPRLSVQHGYDRKSAPERYLYVRSLAQTGMSAEEISSVLSISTQEAEQLVNLSRLASLST